MRYPAVAGRFYPSGREELIESIEECFRHRLGPGMPGPEGNTRKIVAAVSPHAGYMASGMNAAHLYKKIKEDGLPEFYVIIGPDHHGVPYDAVMCSDEYLTPLGPCKIEKDVASELAEYIPDSSRAHMLEHSVEVQVPFIQYIDPDPHIIPVILSRQDSRTAGVLADILSRVCAGRDCIIIASSDLSHYIPKGRAASEGSLVLEKIKALDAEGVIETVRKNGISACGYGPISAAIRASAPSEAELLKYSDSHDALGGSSNEVVGYASVAMYR